MIIKGDGNNHLVGNESNLNMPEEATIDVMYDSLNTAPNPKIQKKTLEENYTQLFDVSLP